MIISDKNIQLFLELSKMYFRQSSNKIFVLKNISYRKCADDETEDSIIFKLFNKKYYLDLNETFLDKFKSILKESIINGIINFKNTDLDFLDITFYPNQTENDINLILSNINLTDFDNLNETLSSEFPGLNIEFGYRYAMRNDYIVSHSLFKNDLERYKIKYSDKLNKPYIDEMDISLDSDGFMNKLLNLMKEVGSNL